VTCHDENGILANITQAITDCEANIVSASIQSTIDKRGINTFEVDVSNLEHLRRVMNNVQKVKGTIKVERLKS
jgi:GTP pyrophosphokinase